MEEAPQHCRGKPFHHCMQGTEALIHPLSLSETILAISALITRTRRQSICYCDVCSPFIYCSTEHIENYVAPANMTKVEIGPFADELYCLKRDFALSNLPPEECIKTVRKANTDIELKVVQINLFDYEGEITILELWNDNAILIVRYLWQLLGKKQEILLQFKNLDSASGAKKKRTLAFKRVSPNTFMKDMYSFPVKARIIAEVQNLGASADLPKFCKNINVAEDVQLMCDDLPIRHYSMWHKTIQEQQEDDNPDDLERLIMGATALNVLQKRSSTEETTKPDKGYVPIKTEPEEEEQVENNNKKQRTTNSDNTTEKMQDG